MSNCYKCNNNNNNTAKRTNLDVDRTTIDEAGTIKVPVSVCAIIWSLGALRAQWQ